VIDDAEKEGRIARVEYDEALPVHVSWDLGISDSCALWFFQVTMGEVRVIDFYEHNNVGLEHYVKVMQEKGYWYGDDWLPHDAKVRELGTGRTRVETLINMGRKPKIVPSHKVSDGINAARLLLRHCYFDELNCEQGINSLRSYQREWDDVKRVFRKTPLHNWASHAADSFRYLSIAYRNLKPKEPNPDWREELTKKPSLDEMWEIHDFEEASYREPRI